MKFTGKVNLRARRVHTETFALCCTTSRGTTQTCTYTLAACFSYTKRSILAHSKTFMYIAYSSVYRQYPQGLKPHNEEAEFSCDFYVCISSRVHATLQSTLSVRPSVGWSHFTFFMILFL